MIINFSINKSLLVSFFGALVIVFTMFLYVGETTQAEETVAELPKATVDGPAGRFTFHQRDGANQSIWIMDTQTGRLYNCNIYGSSCDLRGLGTKFDDPKD